MTTSFKKVGPMKSPDNRLAQAVAFAGILAGAAACTATTSGDFSDEVVSGIKVRSYSESFQPSHNPYLIEKSVTFGTDQGGDTYLLSRPIPMGLGDDGTLFVMDLMEANHRFAPDGTHLGQFGSKGEGPGEFRMLQDLVVDGEQVYSADLMLGRMNVFAADGTWQRSIPFPQETVRSPYWSIWGPKSARRFLVARPLMEDAQFSERETNVAWFRIIRLNEQLEAIDTPIDSIRSIGPIREGRNIIPRPYSQLLPFAALAPDMPAAWAWGSEFRVDYYDPDTEERWATAVPHEPLPVTDAMKERTLDAYRRSGRLEQVRRLIEFPEYTPHIGASGLIWDTESRLWAMEFPDPTLEDAPYTYFVFSRDGTWLFTQEMPRRPYLITEEGAYFRESLEDGTPVVQYYLFRDSAGG